MGERARLRQKCPDCGCNCPVCRYRHRPVGPLLSHAVRCPHTDVEVPDA